jgi:hypothetical protein
MMGLINAFTKKKNHRKQSSGQATVEYLLLIALVVGLLLSIYQKQVKAFLTNFKSRKTQYTDVVQQKNLGIPIAWFSGKYGRFGDNAGGSNGLNGSRTNAGGDNEGSGDSTAGQNNGGVNSGNTAGRGPQNKKDGSGDDDGGGDMPDPPGGGGRPGTNAGPSSGSLSLTNTGLGNRRGRTKGGGPGDGEVDGSDSDEEGSGGRGRRGTSTNIRGEGSLGDKEKNDSKKQDDAEAAKENAKSKDKEADEELKKQKELYGSNKEKSAAGGCSKIDLTALIKIAVIVGLLFVLFGMLFQKRGSGQD